MTRVLSGLLLAALILGAAPSRTAVAADTELVIGVLERADDVRYRRSRTAAQFMMQPLGRPFDGAKVALRELKFQGQAAGVAFKLERLKARSVAELQAQIDAAEAAGIRLLIADLPAADLKALAEATAGRELLLFNVSARDDALRQEACQAHLMHLLPSYAMSTDALAQYLSFRKWRRVLSLEGPLPADRQLAAAFARAAKRYGLKFVDRRPFKLSNDPRERELHDIDLLTVGADYDVLFIADSDGEFARNVPYHTVAPRPVVGSEGLAPLAWHWSWERHGAPQLNRRFQKKAKRQMRDVDWAAWLAVKAIGEAALRTGGGDFAKLRAYLKSPDLVLDGFKGNRVNFRPWNNQLRQPILLATHNWVVERAPIPGFLHEKNDLDTLGYDERESRCRF